MQRHTFFKGIPCIADENHLCCKQNHPQTHHSEPRHTLFREISCVAKGKTPFSGTFMQRHTFFKGIPCIADENHLCSGRKPPLQQTTTAPKHTIQSSDTPFSAKFPVSRKEKYRFPEHSCSDTPFSREYPVSRTKTTSAADDNGT